MPFLPTMNPGVESAWIANSAVIVENAVPIRIARPSRARAPARLSSSEASEVSAAAPPTRPKCWMRRQRGGMRADERDDDDRRDGQDEGEDGDDAVARDMVPGDRQRSPELEGKVVLTNS